jgi:hypothetical protein
MSKAEITVANACLELSEQLAGQPQLFDLELLPIERGIMKAARRVAHTGAITCKDEARAAAIGVCKLAGLSDSETARRMKCSRNTVASVVEQLERSGQIPPLKTRLAVKLGGLAESIADEMKGIVDHGVWDMNTSSAVRALGVALGITTEKQLLLTGQATGILEQRVVLPSQDAVREWEDKLKRCFPISEIATSDSGSGDSSPKLLADNADSLAATRFATHSPSREPAFVPLPDPVLPALAPGGGGDRPAAPPAETATHFNG